MSIHRCISPNYRSFFLVYYIQIKQFDSGSLEMLYYFCDANFPRLIKQFLERRM